LLETLLIAALILQRQRRKRAELSAEERRTELAHTLRVVTIGEMTAAISHEINQPLGAILSNAEAAEMLLDSDILSVAELRQIHSDIRRDDLRASEVVQRLRGFLQKHVVETQLLDLNELIAEVLRLMGPEAARRGVTLDAQPTPGSSLVDGDRVQLQQLLINLIMNAMDAMVETPAGRRRVVLRLSEVEGRRVEIAVSDAGHGIDSGASKRLFESFFTTKSHGLGLGLSIARTIAELHGGEIRAENNPSGGATFRVTLPQRRGRPSRPAVSAEASRAGAT
jgi:C4-dicarboxylate-specific signal transduction histidine kinase